MFIWVIDNFMCLDREVLSLSESKKKSTVENTPTAKIDTGNGCEHERITRSEEEGFYSSCGQAFIRIS